MLTLLNADLTSTGGTSATFSPVHACWLVFAGIVGGVRNAGGWCFAVAGGCCFVVAAIVGSGPSSVCWVAGMDVFAGFGGSRRWGVGFAGLRLRWSWSCRRRMRGIAG